MHYAWIGDGRLLKENLASFAITNFDRVHNSLMRIRANHNSVGQNKKRLL